MKAMGTAFFIINQYPENLTSANFLSINSFKKSAPNNMTMRHIALKYFQFWTDGTPFDF